MNDVEALERVLDELRRRSLRQFAEGLRDWTPQRVEAALYASLWSRREVALCDWERWLVVDVLGFPTERLEAITCDVQGRRPPPGDYARFRPVIAWRYADAFLDAIDDRGELPKV